MARLRSASSVPASTDPLAAFLTRCKVVAEEQQRIVAAMRLVHASGMPKKKIPDDIEEAPKPKPRQQPEVPAELFPEDPAPGAPKSHFALAELDRELLASIERVFGPLPEADNKEGE